MNKQITEDYCSYEVAKLLKEKGFKNEYCDNMLLAEDGGVIYKFATFRNKDDAFYATMRFKKQIPYVTHQMALKWLREVHNIFVEISVDEMLADKGYQWALLFYNDTKIIMPYAGWENTYEQAVEAALLYVLKNLI